MNRGTVRARRVVVLAAVLACLPLALTACSGDPAQPSPTHSVVPAETSAPTPSATKPTVQLWQPTAQSAKAFIKYFFDVYNYSYATLDPTLLEEISKPSCKTCAGMVANIKALKRQGFTVTGNDVLLIDAVFPTEKLNKNNHIYALAVMSQEPGNAIARNGKITKVDGTTRAQNGFGLDWDGGRWLVQGISDEGKGTPWPSPS